ncbi:MAG TPA: N-acetylmuramoyl-L-alanine amidase family protein [Limnochordia bacterium]|nr:N-acetylmuramoyl-L-alanine amidase family protein [Limnochordia bacterium]
MKRPALIAFFLLSFLLFSPSLADASLKLFVDDVEVALQRDLVMINGNYMIPLWVFAEHLGAQVQVDQSHLQIVFPDQTIQMQLGAELALVDGKEYKLEVAPQLLDGEIIVPLRFMADQRHLSLTYIQELNGFRLSRKAPRFSGLGSLLSGEGLGAPTEGGEAQPVGSEREEKEPGASVVLYEPSTERGLKEIAFLGGPRATIFLDLESYTGYQTYLLEHPARLVIDLYGVNGDPPPALEVDSPVVSSIRASRFDEQTLRVVCDLQAPTGYQVLPAPEGGLTIEFNYQLTALQLEEVEGNLVLSFASSAAPEVHTTYLQNPLRLVLDFQDTTLMTRSFDLTVNLGPVVRFRAGQHSPSVTRVVLELSEPLASLPIEERAAGSFIVPLFQGTASDLAAYLRTQQDQRSGGEGTELLPVQEGVLSGLVIAVDPGHGGSDPGTIGYRGTFEKDVNLAISLYLGELLSEAGAKVVYTRDSDVYVSIFRRPEIALEAQADLFVSIHVNSHIERGRARGTETLYRAGDPISERFARIVQDELVKAITLIDRRIWGRNDLAVFNGSDIPSILVEVGFLDHPDEEVLLRAPGFQEAAAQGIFNGIVRFYLENKR